MKSNEYNPEDIKIYFDGIEITGYSTGTFYLGCDNIECINNIDGMCTNNEEK
jgi:hypothetical protein